MVAEDDLRLNDPVHVEQSSDSSSGKPPLEGVVAHLGPVEFAPGSDWVGVKLTGGSSGRGKNDGTVKGVRYFNPGGSKNGMFVKASTVKKRKLTKLEELRMRREAGASAGSTVGSRASSAPGGSGAAKSSIKSPTVTRGPRKSMSGKVSPIKKPSSAAASSTPAAGGGGPSKLEQIRARREALAKERNRGNPTVVKAKEVEGGGDDDKDESKEGGDEDESKEEGGGAEPAVNLSAATPGYRAELHRLQSKIAGLETSLQKKTADCASLQSSLDFMSKGAEQSTHDAVRMYAMGALALTEAKSPSVARNLGGRGGTPSGTGSFDEEKEDDDDGEDGNGSDEEKDDEGQNEEVVNQAAAAVSQALVQRNDELTSQLSALTAERSDLRHQLSEAEERISNVTSRHEQAAEDCRREREARDEEQTGFNTEKAVLTSQIASLERELGVLQDRVSSKSSTQEHSHLSVAKLRAELTSAHRRNEALDEEKTDLETTLEELVLDKEQLREEKEMLEDQLEECKIDLESAQLELEDARSQLEEGHGARAVAEATGEGGGADVSFSSDAADAADAARALTLQNTRLRTALLRLREQSDHERNELQRQLKALQSDAAVGEELQEELTALKSTHATTLREVQELKDIIDQTTSLEETIETLSDKVWTLEETNADLERTIRELEESAEIAAEMEEVQADELKMVMRDLEGRDALVGNLEEAIRMQRRREEDFQRYVSEFRTSISTLKSEKAALLALTDDNQGEKSHLLATSQKALAQAAQLAADAAEARKRSSEAAFQRITARSAGYLSQRLETLLPSGVVSAELAAVKGEMSLARVADKAAASLTAVEEVFNKAIEKGSAGLSEFDTLEGEGASMVISDAANQQIAVMAHQAEFSRMAVEGATDALRLMAAGQWPELLSQETSADLGSVAAHSVADLDLALSEQLRLLKSEGVLSPLRSSLADLDQSVNNTRLALFSATDESGKTVIPNDWKPPGWEALKSLSLGRFACLGATAALASAVSPMEDAENEPPPATHAGFAAVLTKAKQSCASMLDVCKKLSGLSLNDAETLESLNDLSRRYQSSSSAFLNGVKTAFEGQSITNEDVKKFASLLDEVLSAARLLAALLRKADLGDHDTTNHHSLSAEFGDSWGGVTDIVSRVRSVDGDAEDVNYLMRARAIENQLAEAVQNEPKLVISNAKIASLEKSLSSRSKEIHMQNGRIAELETLISKSSKTSMSPLKGSIVPSPLATSSVDTQKLKGEVRMLQEALEVMQKQAEEYEKEIRSLKDKTRTARGVRAGGGRTTPKKSAADLQATLNQLGQAAGGSKSAASSSRDVLLESISLETALFRPALGSAARSASYWKAKAVGSVLSELAPLNVPVARQSMPWSTGGEAKEALDNLLVGRGSDMAATNWSNRRMEELELAKNEARLAKASFSIVDLSRDDISPRAQLEEKRRRERAAESRLREATSLWLGSTDTTSLTPGGVGSTTRDGGSLVGRITLPCRGGTGFVAPLSVSGAELRNLHSFLVQ